MPSEFLTSLSGALQAAVSVLLTIYYGVLGAQFNLLDSNSAKRISRMCVNMFLPALLIVNLGSELHLDTVTRYIPVLSKPKNFHCSLAWKVHDFSDRYSQYGRFATPFCPWVSASLLPEF